MHYSIEEQRYVNFVLTKRRNLILIAQNKDIYHAMCWVRIAIAFFSKPEQHEMSSLFVRDLVLVCAGFSGSLGVTGLVPQHHCFGALKQQEMNPKSIWRNDFWLVDVIVKLRQRGKKDQPPKLYVVTLLIFQIKRTTQREKWFIVC